MPCRISTCCIVALQVLVGCGEGSTPTHALLVELDTDLIPGIEFVGIQTDLLDRLPDAGEVRVLAARQTYASTAFNLPFRAAEFEALEPGTKVLRIRMLASTGELRLEQWLIVELGAANTLATAVLSRSCEGVSCPGNNDGGDALACLAGRCVDPRCTRETPELCPAPECATPTDCPAVAACAEARCDFGVCLPVVRGFACGLEEYCQPSEGCLTTECPPPGPRSNGERCVLNSDCINACLGGTCSDPSDPGGVCDPSDAADCAPGLSCPVTTCLGPNGTGCSDDDMCLGICNGTVCTDPDQPNGNPCDENSDCVATCVANLCRDVSGPGGPCDTRADCLPALACVANECSVPIPTFDIPPLAATPLAPFSTRFGDINGDGSLDIITTMASQGVGVHLGNGDGTVAALSTYPVPSAPSAVVVGDLNADGREDVVVANGFSLSTLLGQSNGTLGVATTQTTSGRNSSLALQDVNADGDVDLVAVAFSSDELEVFLGAGDGTLTSTFSTVPGDGPNAAILQDYNEDGNLDVAVTLGNTDQVSVRPGSGDGTFGSATTFSVGDDPRWAGSADFDEDGHLDLVTGNANGRSFSVLLGVGDGTFGVATTTVIGTFIDKIATSDINNDGHSDLIVTQSNELLAVFAGNGDGTFQSPSNFGIGSGGDLDIGDLDQNGTADIVVVSGSGVSIMLGTGTGTYPSIPISPLSASADHVRSGDFNNDGVPDIVAGNSIPAYTAILLGLGGGAFGPSNAYPMGGFPQSHALADVDGDGNLDLAAALFQGPVSVRRGRGDGTFEPAVSHPVGSRSDDLAFADLNQDGLLDVVVADKGGDTVGILLGVGGGSFGSATFLPGGTGPTGVELSDLNNDSHVDIVVASRANTSSSMVMVYLGAGDGSFALSDSLALARAQDAALGDLDQDGDVDMVADRNVFRGNGDGTFTQIDTLEASSPIVRVADVNGDGRLDCLRSPRLHLGLGNGSFAAPTTLPVSPIEAADLNGDGLTDLFAPGVLFVRTLLQTP